ncbi:FTR1 family protein [soil metagenome]
MLANLLIGLREGLEAALVVGILIAYVTKIGRRDVLPKLWLGVSAAILVSLIVGAVLTFGPSTLSFQAQETIGGSMSILAVGLVTWMIFWMAKHSRNLKHELEGQLASAVKSTGAAVVVLGLVSVGREGIETALFIWASANTGNNPAIGMLGAVIGILIAVVLAYVIFRGLVRFNLGKFFAWTGGLLVFVAAGVLAYGVHDLQEAGVVPGVASVAYSVAQVVPPTSWYGVLLTGLFSFSAEPTWLQVAVWVAYVAVVLTLFIRAQRRPRFVVTTDAAASESRSLASSAH